MSQQNAQPQSGKKPLSIETVEPMILMSGSTAPIEDINTLQAVEATQSQVEATPDLVVTTAAPSSANLVATGGSDLLCGGVGDDAIRAEQVAICYWGELVTIRFWAKQVMICSRAALGMTCWMAVPGMTYSKVVMVMTD